MVDGGVVVRPPLPNLKYSAFADPSGGGGGDAFTLGIAHREPDGTAVLDYIAERRPPFNAAATVAEFAKVLSEYRVAAVTGDRYAGAIIAQHFAANSITYNFSTRDRSQIYTDALPLMTSGKARLLDNKKLVAQIASLERRTGPTRDRIDHPDHGHDDLCNAACCALTLAAVARQTFLGIVPDLSRSALGLPRGSYFGDANYRAPASGVSGVVAFAGATPGTNPDASWDGGLSDRAFGFFGDNPRGREVMVINLAQHREHRELGR